MTRKVGPEWLLSKQKRAMDIAVASVAAPIASLVMVPTAALISITELEPPLITQQRYGRGGRPLRIAKLRTMPHGTEETMSNGHYDPRRTKIGRILSATRLDEGPQLWNVLTGSMSLVGLRPLVQVHHDEFISSLPSKERARVEMAYSIARPGWFDPYGVDLYVNGIEDTHEARAESIIKYVYEGASYNRDWQIMFHAFGIVKHLRGDSGVNLLPETNPAAVTQTELETSQVN